MMKRSVLNIAYALVVAVAVPLVVYAAASIPADCATPGDCDSITPRFETLTVKHTMSGQHLYVSGTGSSPLIVTSADGYVGIGTALPTTSIDIVNRGGAAYVQSTSYRTSAFAGGLVINHARGTLASPVALSPNDRAGSIFFAGYDGAAFNNMASIEAFAEVTPVASTSTPGRLTFSTTPTGSIYQQERMRITGSGSVGIGTTSPSVKLEINGAHVPGKGLILAKGISDNGFIVADTDTPLTKEAGFAWQYGGTSKWWAFVGDGSTDLQFYSEYGYQVTFQLGGNVGIGTTTPRSKLEVSSVIQSTPTDSPGTCNSTVEGGMYYDDSMNEPCFCDATGWKQFDGGGACS